MKKTEMKILAAYLVRDCFIASLVLFLILLFLEDIKPGFASHNMDLQIMLALCASSGLASLLTSKFLKEGCGNFSGQNYPD